ncbi:GNAT family N-acetyltransferase [Yoonia sp. 2307UL14-13]|uniref:GNAT family N-acetyltransferase n=1 Tax=Yoonia sp. 2307UL14-13 TaxID=3126506 RepID=UPI0030ABC0FA
MILRAATPSDVDDMADILGHWFNVTNFVPRLHTVDEDRWFIRQAVEKSDVIVADDAGVRGFIVRNGEEIGQLYLAPDARGRGIGAALLDKMKARADRLSLFCFQENTGARRFYERHGFVAKAFSDGSHNEEQVPDVHYVWRSAP